MQLPIRDKVLDRNGFLTEPWRKWFEEAGGVASIFSKYSAAKYIVTTVDPIYLTALQLGKVIKAENGVNGANFKLPSVGRDDVDAWIAFVRLGTGRLVIDAADSDVIEKSSPGGRIVCMETGRVAASIILFLASETCWSIFGGIGVWHVY